MAYLELCSFPNRKYNDNNMVLFSVTLICRSFVYTVTKHDAKVTIADQLIYFLFRCMTPLRVAYVYGMSVLYW